VCGACGMGGIRGYADMDMSFLQEAEVNVP
jgi:hypothetical protein